MMYNWETFQTAYQAATPETKAIIDSDVIPRCVRVAITSNNLDASHHGGLVKLLSLAVLGVVKEAVAIEELRELGVPEGKSVFDQLLTCVKNTQLTPTPEETGDEPKDIPTPPPSVPRPPSDIASEISETEAVLSKIPQMRTMGEDMKQSQPAGEMIYTSTQEAILKESKPVPTPDDKTPRWGETK